MNKKELEQENAALRGCIESVQIRIAGYDGYNTVEGLKHLIDIVKEDLDSGWPERFMNDEHKEVCPLCFSVLEIDKT